MKHTLFRLFGFTLIEFLIVFGVLAVLLGITIIALNPIEQFRRANDLTRASVVKDFVSATKYYYIAEKSSPWQKDSSCKNELRTGKTLADIPSCAKQLTEGGKLQEAVMSAKESKDVYVTECNDNVAVCYSPKSQQFTKAGEAKYTSNGVLQSGCPNGNDCYACTFSTPEAQECFQALNPNGSLAYGPTPAPGQPLPVPQRHAKKTCSEPDPNEVGCLADVVTDSDGNPLTSLALPGGYGPAQLHTAYNLPCTPGGQTQSICNTPTSFGPQTLAVILAYHYPTVEEDLAMYNQTYGLPPCTKANGCLTIVNQLGVTSEPPPIVSPDWALEAALDVQISHAICQTCKILLVEAKTNSWYDIIVAVRRAALMGATSISNSYGAPEASGETTLDSNYDHPGIYVVAASGDSGYGTFYPAASKHVIAVGGTNLFLFADNTYASETVWYGTGSGCALFEPAQSFQTALSNWNTTGCGTKKGIVDVSAVAAPNTGVAIYDSTAYGGRTGWWILGGTSVSSPLVSAAFAMKTPAPSNILAASFIYANPSKFRDVTNGSNGSCGNSMCTAGVGYDGPTGLGSPNLFVSETSGGNSGGTGGSGATGSPTPSPIPPITCPQLHTVSLASTATAITTPGKQINNILAITNNDLPECTSTFTVSKDLPSGWTNNDLPTSITIQGGVTNTFPFSIKIPTTTSGGNYAYQLWVAKSGIDESIPVTGNVQIQETVPTNTPTPTTPPLNCSQVQTVSLTTTSPIVALPGTTVNNNLIITNNDQTGCSSLFTVSRSFPSGWTINGIPASTTLTGGATSTSPFTIQIPANASAGNYSYQFWVAKSGQSSVNPVTGSIQVQQVGPTNTPTPAPVSCTGSWSQSLGNTYLSGNAGETLSQTITITNNNPTNCTTQVTYGFSSYRPSGFTFLNVPPSVKLSGGQSITIPISIIIPTGAQIQDNQMGFWINGGTAMNMTVHVTGTADAPQEQMFSNFGAKLYGSYALFEFSYNAYGESGFRLDIATDPTVLNQISGANSTIYYSFASTPGRALDASNITTPTSVRGFIQSSPQYWSRWQCGAMIYWRMYFVGDLRIKSPIQSGVVDCTTVVNVLPWSPWYDAIYRGIYDARYDADNNGIVDWTDYWVLVRATRLR